MKLAWPVLERLAEDGVVDVGWLEGCPLIKGIERDPRMPVLRTKGRARARAIWAVQ